MKGSTTIEHPHPSVADLLVATGPLAEAETRGIGAWLAGALATLHAAGVVHGRVTPAAIRFSFAGEPTLTGIGTPAASSTLPADGDPGIDVAAVAATVVECATTVAIDVAVPWTRDELTGLGCTPALAGDVEAILRERPRASRVAGILQRHDDRLPRPPSPLGAADRRRPTAVIPSVAIAGLSPLGGTPSAANRPDRHGWRRWATGGRG